MKRLLLAVAWALSAPWCAAEEGDKPQAPARLVAVEVTLAEFDPALWPEQDSAEAAKLLQALRAAESQDKVYALTQIRLSALENQPATAHWGERVAVPTGRTLSAAASSRAAASGFGGVTTNYQRESLGTIVAATCRIDEGGLIVIDLNVEQSRLAADTEVKLNPSDPDASALLKPVTKTLKTAVSVPDGQTIVLGGMTTKSGKQLRQDVLLVTARIIGSTPVKATVRLPAARSGEVPDGSASERLRRYAEQMIARYDQNGDGVLSASEKSMSPTTARADKDGNGIVTLEELIAELAARQGTELER